MQLALALPTEAFTIADSSPDAWRRLSAPGCKTTAHWRHQTGWDVVHCGHPTAIWPFEVRSPSGRRVFAANGKGFADSRKAKAAVHAILANRPVVVTVPGSRFMQRIDGRELREEAASA